MWETGGVLEHKAQSLFDQRPIWSVVYLVVVTKEAFCFLPVCTWKDQEHTEKAHSWYDPWWHFKAFSSHREQFTYCQTSYSVIEIDKFLCAHFAPSCPVFYLGAKVKISKYDHSHLISRVQSSSQSLRLKNGFVLMANSNSDLKYRFDFGVNTILSEI